MIRERERERERESSVCAEGQNKQSKKRGETPQRHDRTKGEKKKRKKECAEGTLNGSKGIDKQIHTHGWSTSAALQAMAAGRRNMSVSQQVSQPL